MSRSVRDFHPCMDCGPDVSAECRACGCQVDKLVEREQRAVQKDEEPEWPVYDEAKGG